MNNKKQKKFTVQYRVDGLYDAEISADTIEEVLAKAQEMTVDQLHAAQGGTLDEEAKITGVWE